ncbi:MAG TPA: DUF5658 family protein [Fimbriimonadaceae bacterium]|nr:DUF5658 family protein [Fimbriimonadaceae bacterium]
MRLIRQAFPSRAILLILMIGLIDLITTAILHASGQIVEMNPLMRGFINRSEWLFVGVKGMTLLVGWLMLVHYARHNINFVRRACLFGSAAYVVVWLVWFLHGAG